MAKAQWTTVPRDITATVTPDGAFKFSAPLLDGGVKQLTLSFEVTADRVVKVFVKGELTATLSGFEAWSNI